MTFHVPEKHRIIKGKLASDSSIGNNGAFSIFAKRFPVNLHITASDKNGFEHVTVAVSDKRKKGNQSPTWEEMQYVKTIFWDDFDTVIQYHPWKNDYINGQKNRLHLWRIIDKPIAVPTHITGRQDQ